MMCQAHKHSLLYSSSYSIGRQAGIMGSIYSDTLGISLI